jgi:hypothetical protein
MDTDLEALLRDAGRTPPASGINLTRAMDQARTVRKRRRLTVAGGTAVVLVAGVTFALAGLPPADRAPAPGGTAGAGADPVQTQLERNLMLAHISGTVQRSGDCLVLDRGGDRVVVVWPSGSRWSADDEVVVLPDGLRVGLGDEVEGSGGHVPAGWDFLNRALGEESAYRAISCAKSSGRRSVVLIENVTKR